MRDYSFKLSLYLTTPGHPEIFEAIQNLKDFLNEELKQDFELHIINVLQNPERAAKDGVIATPTLIKEMPPPSLRIVGDFTDRKKVLAALGLS